MNELELLNIIEHHKDGDKEAFNILLNMYDGYIKKISYDFYLNFGDRNDIIQHGYIGLWKGLKYLNTDKTTCISVFLKMCIRREIYTAIKLQDRLKHRIMNKSKSIEETAYNDKYGGKTTIGELAINVDFSAEHYVIEKEEEETVNNQIKAYINRMPKMQKRCIQLYLKGFKQSEICKITNLKKKQVDNALTRAKYTLKNKYKNIKGV